MKRVTLSFWSVIPSAPAIDAERVYKPEAVPSGIRKPPSRPSMLGTLFETEGAGDLEAPVDRAFGFEVRNRKPEANFPLLLASEKSRVASSAAPVFFVTMAAISVPGRMTDPSVRTKLSTVSIFSVYKELRSELERRPEESSQDNKAIGMATAMRKHRVAEGNLTRNLSI